jgi:hypothetical protein
MITSIGIENEAGLSEKMVGKGSRRVWLHDSKAATPSHLRSDVVGQRARGLAQGRRWRLDVHLERLACLPRVSTTKQKPHRQAF